MIYFHRTQVGTITENVPNLLPISGLTEQDIGKKGLAVVVFVLE